MGTSKALGFFCPITRWRVEAFDRGGGIDQLITCIQTARSSGSYYTARGGERWPTDRVKLTSMMKRNLWITWAAIAWLSAVPIALSQQKETEPPSAPVTPTAQDLGPVTKLEKTNAEWKTTLSPAQFAVLREKGTERAGSSPLLKEHRAGVFRCAACDLPVFASDAKFESGTGWPSFWKPFVAANVITATDSSLGMERDEVLCARCGGHLGHVFDDGPQPTGLRYCLNGVALKFEPRN
jgi:peptide-methionine (R)-S-oxide reductase